MMKEIIHTHTHTHVHRLETRLDLTRIDQTDTLQWIDGFKDKKYNISWLFKMRVYQNILL